ncbi:MAG: hypothetical protein VYB44_07405 [Bacteroidota bacterium]|nr:hypothetical protein [Bacteroidota bacterium]
MITIEQYNRIKPGDFLVIKPKIKLRKRQVLDFFPETGLMMLKGVKTEGFVFVKYKDISHRVKSIIHNKNMTVTEWLSILNQRGDKVLSYGKDYIHYKHKATGKLRLIEL